MAAWTTSDIKQLRHFAAIGLCGAEIAERLGRRPETICAAAKRYEVQLQDGRRGKWKRVKQQ